MRKIKAVQIGIGALGSRIVRHILEEREGIQYVGGIDIRPELVGKDLGKAVGFKKLGVGITDKPENVFSKKPHIAIHTTSSYFEQIYPQIKTAVKYGVNVISTCEQLSYPKLTNKKLAKELDRLAKENKVTVLGTGINPGFLMDVRPFILTTGCTEVHQIEVTRWMNASPRRKPFQRKIGAAMQPETFEKAIEKGEITGHVGLEESIALIAESVGWELSEIEVESVKPVFAKESVSSEFFTVKKGEVKGVVQEAYGVIEGEKKIKLRFKAALGVEPSYDEVKIDGTPEISARITPCWHGDHGTVAIVTNLIPTVIKKRSGLLKMNDIANLSYKSGNMAKFMST